MELPASSYNLNNVLVLDQIPEISQKTRNLDVCQNICNQTLSNQPVDSLKTRVTEFKELTDKLANAEENPKKMIVIASLLAVTL